MNRLFSTLITITILAIPLFFSGCGESVVEPEDAGFDIQGIVIIGGSGDVTEVDVVLYERPYDNQIKQTLNSYPTVELSDYQDMLFNPCELQPIATMNPNVNGQFGFPDLSAGSYIVNLEYAGYGCVSPAVISLHGDQDLGNMMMTEVEVVDGSINTHTVWQEGSVYLVTGDLNVNIGYSLTIEEGTLILLGGNYEINIFGKLTINGIPANPAVFRLQNGTYDSNDEWKGITIKATSDPCDITGAVIHDAAVAVDIRGANTEIRECLIKNSDSFSIYFGQGTTGSVINSIVMDGQAGLRSDGSGPEFANNLVLRMAVKGIEVSESQANIHNNVILDCATGMFCDWDSSPMVTRNLISGGEIGLHAEQNFYATIQYNEFSGQSSKGIYFSYGYCYPEVMEFNNFTDMPENIMWVEGGGNRQADSVFARNNYWDGEDASGIPDRIKDGYDLSNANNTVGPVIFEPYFTDLVSGAGP